MSGGQFKLSTHFFITWSSLKQISAYIIIKIIVFEEKIRRDLGE